MSSRRQRGGTACTVQSTTLQIPHDRHAVPHDMKTPATKAGDDIPPARTDEGPTTCRAPTPRRSLAMTDRCLGLGGAQHPQARRSPEPHDGASQGERAGGQWAASVREAQHLVRQLLLVLLLIGVSGGRGARATALWQGCTPSSAASSKQFVRRDSACEFFRGPESVDRFLIQDLPVADQIDGAQPRGQGSQSLISERHSCPASRAGATRRSVALPSEGPATSSGSSACSRTTSPSQVEDSPEHKD